NLLSAYGTRFRITFDEAYSARNRPRSHLDPWMMEIPCRFGTIYPYGGAKLAVEMRCGPKSTQLAALPGVQLSQDGDRELTFLFDAVDFSKVSAIVHPKRRRVLTDAHKAKLAATGKRFASQTRV